MKIDGRSLNENIPPKESLIRVEVSYRKLMKKLSRVKEDGLQDLNLGSMENSKHVKVSVSLDGDFKGDLKKILQKLMDVFAWD